jgi:hypothetical protein
MIEGQERGEDQDGQGEESRGRGSPVLHDADPVLITRPEIRQVQVSGFQETVGRREDLAVVGDPPGAGGGQQMHRSDEQEGPKPGGLGSEDSIGHGPRLHGREEGEVDKPALISHPCP